MKNNFSENFSWLRRMKNLSKRDLAQQTGISEMAIGYYERGDRSPTLENLIKIADVFGVSLDKLVRGDVDQLGETGQKRHALYNAVLDLPPEKLPLFAKLVEVTEDITGKHNEDNSIDYEVKINIAPKAAQNTKGD